MKKKGGGGGGGKWRGKKGLMGRGKIKSQYENRHLEKKKRKKRKKKKAKCLSRFELLNANLQFRHPST